MRIYNSNIVTQENISAKNQYGGKNADAGSSAAFQSIFSDKLEKSMAQASSVQFSKHASMRLNNRNLSLSSEQIKRVEMGIDKAVEKGINDSLVLVDDIALVVNVKNKIVITAMNKNNDANSVFTNIDGAVIV